MAAPRHERPPRKPRLLDRPLHGRQRVVLSGFASKEPGPHMKASSAPRAGGFVPGVRLDPSQVRDIRNETRRPRTVSVAAHGETPQRKPVPAKRRIILKRERR